MAKLGQKPTNVVTIPRDRYFRLLCSELKLDLLEAGGVDNWDWYGESLYCSDGDYNYDTLIGEIKEEVYGEQDE